MHHLTFILLALSAGLSTSGLSQTVTAQKSDKGVKLAIDGQLFSEYLTVDTPKPCMFPIMDPFGVNITRHYPLEKTELTEDQDHPHHRGLWFAHGEVNDIDFWAEGSDKGKIIHEKFENIQASGSTGGFSAHSKWVDSDGDTILTDKRDVKLEARADGERVVDFVITLNASEDDVTFGDTKEGTMALRVGTSLSLKLADKSKGTGKAINSGGIKGAKVWGVKANWVCYYGPDAKGNPVSIVIYDHPSNLRYPTWWHARDYGLFAANPFGQHDFEKLDGKPGEYELAKGKSLTLRYRIQLLKGEPNPEKFNTEAKAFADAK